MYRTFKAALRYLVPIILPESYQYLNDYYLDRLASLLEVTINAGFIAYCGSFLTEYLYGLTRLHNGKPITWSRKLVSIIVELIIPNLFDLQQFPILKKALNFTNLVFGFAYAVLPKALSPSVEFYIQNLSYGRHETIGLFNTDPSTIFGWVLKHGSLLLYLSFKILQWYYAHEESNKAKPIKIQPPSFEGYLNRNKGVCGICGRIFEDPVCLETSGCCFCYICIYKYLRASKKCPISGVPSDIKNIRKIRLG